MYTEHTYTHAPDGKEVTRWSSENIVRYAMPSSGHVLVFGGSSIIRNRKKKENELRKLQEDAAAQDAGGSELPAQPVQGNFFAVRGMPAGDAKAGRAGRAAPGDGAGRPYKSYRFSNKSAGHIRKSCTALYGASVENGFPFVFVTLTFLNDVDDAKAVRCLTSYLNNLKKRKYRNDYVWVMERQKTGRPHFHIAINRWVNIDEENLRWTRVQYNAGIKKVDTNGVEYSRAEMEAVVKIGGIKKFANSYDVKKVKDVGGVAAYVTKYISKSVYEGTEYGCRPWGCSVSVSRLWKSKVTMPELWQVALSEDNNAVAVRDIVDKSTGEIRYEKGNRIRRREFVNKWCASIQCVDSSLFRGEYAELNKVNAEQLLSGVDREPEYVSWTDYYNRFVWDYSPVEVEMFSDKEPYATPLGWCPGRPKVECIKTDVGRDFNFNVGTKRWNGDIGRFVWEVYYDWDLRFRVELSAKKSRASSLDNARQQVFLSP